MRGGRADNSEALADLDGFGGAPAEWAQGLENDEQEFEIEPDNWNTVQTWLHVQTQWRHGFGGATGLDYTAVDVAMRRLRIEDEDGGIFAGLQVMEYGALRAMTAKG